MRLDLSEEERAELRAGELKCTCQVSTELLDALAPGEVDLTRLRRAWNRYLTWHEVRSGGPLERIAILGGLPLVGRVPPGVEI